MPFKVTDCGTSRNPHVGEQYQFKVLSRTISELSRSISQLIAFDNEPLFNALVRRKSLKLRLRSVALRNYKHSLSHRFISERELKYRHGDQDHDRF